MSTRTLFTACAIAASAQVSAGVMQGTVSLLMTDAVAPNQAFLKINGSFTQAEPGCAPSTNYDFVFDPTTDMGKRWYATLLAAQASGATVEVGGTDQCILRVGYEDLRYVQVGP
jgi:hypothetical protein